jgi:TolB protein
MVRNVLTVAAAAAVAMLACEPPEGGGGGGIGVSSFTRGFVFVRADDKNVYASDSATGFTEVARLTRNGENKHPSLSPNGQQVIFVNSGGGSSALMVVPMSGGEPRTLLGGDASVSRFANPVFSPDGQRVAFTFERGGASILGVIDADGSRFAEVSSGALSYASPSFYPDGVHVLVAAGSLGTGYTQLERVNLDTGLATNVLNGLGNEARKIRNRVVLSPDGSRAAFDGELAAGTTRIFAVDVSSRAVTQLTDYPADPNANDSFPTWSGASEVAFSSDTGGNDQVYTVPVSAVKQPGSLKLPSAIEPWFGPN